MSIFIRHTPARHQPVTVMDSVRARQRSPCQPGMAASLLAALLILLCLLGILRVLGQDWHTDLRGQARWQAVQTYPGYR